MFLKNKIQFKIFLVALIFCGALFLFSAGQAQAYANSASWTSPVKMHGFQVMFGIISWTEISSVTSASPAPANSAITMDVRAGDSAVVDSTWTNGGNWTTFANGQSLASLGLKKNIQYRVNFAYDDLTDMPGVSDVTISTYSGELISSVYDTRDYGNKITMIGWSKQIAGQSNVFLQVRTSPDNTTWTPWCGPDNGASGCDSNTWFTDSNGGETIDTDFKTSDMSYDSKTSDRFIQYKIGFFGDGINMPKVNDVTFGYNQAGTMTLWVSPVTDTGQISNFGNIAWTQTIPAETSVSVDVKAGNTVTSDATWTNGGNWTNITSSGQSLSAFSGNRYIQYRINMSSYDVDSVASVSDVTIPYSSNPAGAYKILSSPYNTKDAFNLLAKIEWSENVSANTNVKFQMRSAPDNVGAPDWANGSGWCGPVNCSVTKTDEDYATDFYETTPAGENANPIHKVGDNDQWIQYVVWLETNSTAFVPTVSETTLTYVVNVTPELQNIVSTQNSDGTVTTTFEVRDPDTSTGATNGTILGGLQYCTANCADSGNETWTDATTLIYKNESAAVLPNNVLDIEESDFTPYQIIWTPKTDYNNEYNENLKVKISANDSEAANNIGYGISNAFVLDTKDPGNLSINVDHRSDKEIITIKNETGAVDDSTYKLYLSTTGSFDDSNEIPLPSPLTYPYEYDYSAVLSSITDQGTVWLKIKDVKGNVNDYNIQNQTMVVIPPKPKRILFYDISNVTADPPDYRELIAWTELSFSDFESYNVVKCSTSKDIGESGNDCENEALPFNTLPDGQSVISDVSINFLPDKELAPSIRNYYKVFTKDDYGNYSTYSDVVSDVPDGNGASSTTPPTITSVRIPAETITTTSATIKWDTNEISDSTVGYALDSESTPEYLPEYGNATLTNDHSLIITGLSPNKTYAVRVKSRDANGNLATVDKFNNSDDANVFVFTTKEGPEILSFTFNQISNNEVSIAWNTDTDSDSSIYYSDDILESTGLLNLRGNGDLNSGIVHSDEKVKRHLQSITNLTKSKKYFFYLTSKDVTNNIATDDNAGLFYEFTTDNDETDPVITIDESQPTIKSNNQAVIMWSTDE